MGPTLTIRGRKDFTAMMANARNLSRVGACLHACIQSLCAEADEP